MQVRATSVLYAAARTVLPVQTRETLKKFLESLKAKSCKLQGLMKELDKCKKEQAAQPEPYRTVYYVLNI